MAFTELVPQAITDEGIVPAYVAAAAVDGNSIPGDGDTFIHVINGGGGAITVTVVTGGTLLGEPVADKAVSVAAGAEKFIGPFPPVLYNQPSGDDAGKVLIQYSGVTSVTVGAFTI